MLVIVAPVTMTTEQREIWLRGAVDALEGISAQEVAAVSAELRRSVTRHNQIVPEISRLVAEKRARSQQSAAPQSPYFAEREINLRSTEMRAAAKGDKRKMSDAYEWERQARIDAGLAARPYPKPLTQAEIAKMPAHIKTMGLKAGFLIEHHGEIVEAA